MWRILLFNIFQFSVGYNVMGGTNADIKDYPYQLAITYKTDLCGGVLIKENFALTAAHCLNNVVYLDLLLVKGGSSILTDMPQICNVETIFLPKFKKVDKQKYDYDIAILKLVNGFQLNEVIKPIELVEKETHIKNNELLGFTGFGQLYDYGPNAKQLQNIYLPLLDDKQCITIFPNVVTERMLCAGYHFQGTNICYGDSGGPLTYNGKLVGIASHGLPCDGIYGTNVYTKIQYFRSWILKIINTNYNNNYYYYSITY